MKIRVVTARGTWREDAWGKQACVAWDRMAVSYTVGAIGAVVGLVVFMTLNLSGHMVLAWSIFGVAMTGVLSALVVSVVSASAHSRAICEHYGIERRDRPKLTFRDLKTSEQFGAWLAAHGKAPRPLPQRWHGLT